MPGCRTENYPSVPITVADTCSPEGQRSGAVLVVKWISKCLDIKYHPKPHDHVEVLSLIFWMARVKSRIYELVPSVRWNGASSVQFYGIMRAGRTFKWVYSYNHLILITDL